MKTWIDAGFDEKLLVQYDSIRSKLSKIWEEAGTAVFGGKAATRSRLKKKIVDSLRSIVEILSCRYNFSLS